MSQAASPPDGSDAPVIRDIAQISNKLSYWKDKEKQREAEAPAVAENRPRRFSAEGKKLNDLLAFWQNVSQPGSDRTRAATAAPPAKVALVPPAAAPAPSPAKPAGSNLQLPSSHGPPKFRISPSGGLARPIGAATAAGPARPGSSSGPRPIPSPALVSSKPVAAPPPSAPIASAAPEPAVPAVAAVEPSPAPTGPEVSTEVKSPASAEPEPIPEPTPEPPVSSPEPAAQEPLAPEPVPVTAESQPTAADAPVDVAPIEAQPAPAEPEPEPAASPEPEAAAVATEPAAEPISSAPEPGPEAEAPRSSTPVLDLTPAAEDSAASAEDLTLPAISRSTTDFALAADAPAVPDLSPPAISRSTTDFALAESAPAPTADAPAAAFMPPSLSRSSTDFFLPASDDAHPAPVTADLLSPALSRSTTDFALAPTPEEDGLSDTSAADAQPVSGFAPPLLSRSSTDFALIAAEDLAPPPPALPSIPETADGAGDLLASPSNAASEADLPAISRSTTDFALVAGQAPSESDVIQPAISRSITDFELVAGSQPSSSTEEVPDSQALEPVARILSQHLELLPALESTEDSSQPAETAEPVLAQPEAAAVSAAAPAPVAIAKTGSLRRLSDIFATPGGAAPSAGAAVPAASSGAPETAVEDINIDESRDRISSIASTRSPSSSTSFQPSSRTLSKPLGGPSSSSTHHHPSQVELLKQRYPAIRDKLHARSARRVAAVATLSQGVAGQLQRRVLTNAPAAPSSNGPIMMRSRPGHSVPIPADTSLSANKAASMLIGMVATARKDELRAAFADLEPPAQPATQGPSQPATPQLGPSPLRSRTARPSTAKTPQRTMTSLTSLGGLHQRRPSLSENDEEKSVSIVDDKSELSAEERAKKEQESAAKRRKVVEEIVSSEESYVESLERLIQGFIHPMKTSSSLNISAEKTTVIFGNVEILISFHRMFLAQMQAPNANLPELFLKYADFLKMYTQYLNGYNNALNVINSLREHTRFQQFLANKRNNDGMDLMSYLIMPVQRIPRYELLLREMKKHTPASHPEHAALQEAFRKIRLIAKHINEEKRQVENMSKVLEVQNRISGEFQEALLQPYRRLVREGFVFQMTGTLFHSYEQRTVFLFNDMLIWTSQNGKYKGNVKLITAEAKIFATKDKESRSEQYFGLELWNRSDVLKDNAVQFFCRTVAERDSWLTDIQDTIQLLQDIVQPTQRQRMEHRAENIRNRAHDKRHEIHEMIKKSLRNLRDESAMPAMRPLDLSQVSLDVESSVGAETDREDTYDGLATPHSPSPLVDHTIISPDPVDPDFSPDIFDALTRHPRERANSL